MTVDMAYLLAQAEPGALRNQVLGNVLGVVGMFVATYNLIRPFKLPDNARVEESLQRMYRRVFLLRRFTSLLMLLVSILFLFAVNLIDTLKSLPEPYNLAISLALWLVIVLLLGILLVLGVMDLRAVRRLRTELDVRVDQQLNQILGVAQMSVDSEDDEESSV